MHADRPDSKLWWAVPTAGMLLLMGGILIFGGKPEEMRQRTSYDASDPGLRATYLLLEELGYPVERSRRASGGAVRWVLFPSATERDVPQLDVWVRNGGALLLADNQTSFAEQLGLEFQVHTTHAKSRVTDASGLGVTRLDGGDTLVECRGKRGRVLVEASGEPVVTVLEHGRGSIWLVNRPEIMTNGRLRQADNAVLVCRLASAMLEERPGKVSFDEFFHGMRDTPGVMAVLFRPPMLWVSLQALLFVGLLVWRHARRFGTLQPVEPASRRSKEEFLDAMAYLLERKRDYEEAYAAVRDAFRLELEVELGLPAGAPDEQLIREAVARRPIRPGRLRRVLTGKEFLASPGPVSFLHALNELETARNELSFR